MISKFESYSKPELVKHEQLREVTLASKNQNNCSVCKQDEDGTGNPGNPGGGNTDQPGN